ncbi:MAG: ATP-grasp domain-containing protein [Bacteroidaceae bacterium]|nr:ATP-grasp domain-containing protein [Bacteroidaceae bacterium]
MQRAIIIGDATHNTLSAVRSLGEARITFVLIMIADADPLFVRKSRYLNKDNFYWLRTFEGCEDVLRKLALDGNEQTLFTTFDMGAEWVDAREPELSKYFRTPCRGRQLKNLFNKEQQCKLAKECGLTIPFSVVYDRKEKLPIEKLSFPVIIKPLISSKGTKGDIHVCRDLQELESALGETSDCEKFIVQEFIEKDFEVDCVGVRTERDTILLAIRKIRHWPRLVGAGAFAYVEKIDSYKINKSMVVAFLEKAGYYGPFSIEFLHKGGKNYFMEVNLRNEGLAYTATAAGVNLHAYYVLNKTILDWSKYHPVYMMNTSVDFLYVKEKEVRLCQWVQDLMKTRAFININFHDLKPLCFYYLTKLKNKLHLFG